MITLDENRNCKIHGFTLFKHKNNKKGQWWVCYKCLKLQWKKAQSKRRAMPSVREYQKEFNKERAQIIKSLSLTLRVILLATFLKPE